jgi:hypothetical protein
LLLKAVPRRADVQKVVTAIVGTVECPFVLFVVMIDHSIFCGVLLDDPGKAVECRVIGIQIPVWAKSKQAFSIEKQRRNTPRQILESQIGVDVGR